LARTEETLATANGHLNLRDLPPLDVFFGESPGMRVAQEKLARIAPTPIPVLLQGESGTGKEIFARLLHASSGRPSGVWVKVTCPAIPHALIESELFGYERGAFTGAYGTKRGRVELAHRGTLFLDEVDGLDLAAQVKLLQLVQDGTFVRVGGQEPMRVDTRLICTAKGDLRRRTEDGTFRLDLFYRINAVTVELPPLRSRLEDLPILVDYLLNLHAKTFAVQPKPLSSEILKLMQHYHWPGNIRQLENMLRSYVLVGSEEALVADMVPSAQSSLIPEMDLTTPLSLKEITRATTRSIEREVILKVLQANGWSRRKTAKWLNISYRSLLYKLQEVQVNTRSTVRPPKEMQAQQGSAVSRS
jgi:two-component system, NtrC family, response regulator AtoC